jgi:hypothetical protein
MKTIAWMLASALGTAATTSHAEPAPPTSDGATLTDRLTLPKGRVLLNAFAEINLSSNAVGKPISLSPDVWYGVTDDLTIGLVHSVSGRTGFASGLGSALCLSGTGGNCPRVYDNVGADVRYTLTTGPFTWAFDSGLMFQRLDPLQLALKLGAIGRWHGGPLAVEVAPAVFARLTSRDLDEDTLALPITGFYAFAPKLSASLQTGVSLPFQNTSDAWAIPLSLGAHYLATERLRLAVALSLTHLIGGDRWSGVTGFDGRSLTLGGSYAF